MDARSRAVIAGKLRIEREPMQELHADHTRGPGADIAAASRGALMRFIHLFLMGYIILLVGVAMALWKAGVFANIAPIWIAIGSLIAVGLGIMLSVASGRPTITEEIEK